VNSPLQRHTVRLRGHQRRGRRAGWRCGFLALPPQPFIVQVPCAPIRRECGRHPRRCPRAVREGGLPAVPAAGFNRRTSADVGRCLRAFAGIGRLRTSANS